MIYPLMSLTDLPEIPLISSRTECNSNSIKSHLMPFVASVGHRYSSGTKIFMKATHSYKQSKIKLKEVRHSLKCSDKMRTLSWYRSEICFGTTLTSGSPLT